MPSTYGWVVNVFLLNSQGFGKSIFHYTEATFFCKEFTIMMASSCSWILMFCLLATALQSAAGIDCYVCSSSTHGGCGEKPETAHLILAGNVASGCSSCLKVFSGLGTVWSSVTRTCSPSSDVYCENILGYGTCSCTTSFCNGAKSTTMTSFHVMTLLPVLLIAFRQLF